MKLKPRERKKTGIRLKILISNKLLTRLSILLTQIKAGNNSDKLKIEIRKILHLLFQHNKITKISLQQFNQVIIIMKESLVVITEPKTFYFDFDWPKNIDENLKHEIEFIIKSNESLPENKIKARLNNYCPNIIMETIFVNTDNG